LNAFLFSFSHTLQLSAKVSSLDGYGSSFESFLGIHILLASIISKSPNHSNPFAHVPDAVLSSHALLS
jgi:hypothetical protein